MKKTIKVVGAILENSYGEIFCALRPKDKAFANMWEFPGGKIEENENPKMALKREIKEELNIDISVENLFDNVQKEYDNFIIDLSCYICTIIDFSNFKLLEHQDFKWTKKSDLKNLHWVPTDIPTVEKLMG